MVLALTAAAGPPPSPSHVSSLPSVSDVARKVAAAGAKPAANSTSAAPSSTAKPAASSPLGAAAKPATQGALGGGFGATTTASSTFPPLDATTPASPFGAAVNPAAVDSAEFVQLMLHLMMQNVVIVVVYFLVIYEPRGLVRITNLPKQTVWNYLGVSRSQFLDRHSVDCLPNAMSAFKLERNGGNMRYIYTCSEGDQGVTWSPAVGADTPESHGAGGRMEFLDRHNVECPAGSVIAQFKLNAKDNGNRISYSYNCITPAIENKMTCYDKSTSPSSANGFGFNTEYLDRQNVKCGDNEVMQRFRMASNMAANSLLYEYKCCTVEVHLEDVQKKLAEEVRKKAEEEAAAAKKAEEAAAARKNAEEEAKKKTEAFSFWIRDCFLY
jgi:hypothetical protein